MRPANTWNATALRANLATAIQAADREPQIIEVDGRTRAVLIGFEEWQRLRQQNEQKTALKRMWTKLGKLKAGKADVAAGEDLTRPPWRKVL